MSDKRCSVCGAGIRDGRCLSCGQPETVLTPEQIVDKWFGKMHRADEPLYDHKEAKSRALSAIREALAQHEATITQLRERLNTAIDDGTESQMQHAHWKQRTEAAESQLAEVVKVLREHEWDSWSVGGQRACSACHELKHIGNHLNGCWLAALLAKLSGKGAPSAQSR